MVQAWKIAPGEGAEDWELFRENGCIGLGWLRDSDYRDYGSEVEVLAALEQKYGKDAPGRGKGAARMIWQFVHDVKKYHVVVANNGNNRAVGIGIVTSEYLPPMSVQNPIRKDTTTHRHHIRHVDWLITEPIDVPGMFSQSTLYRLKSEKLDRIRQTYAAAYPKLKGILASLLSGVECDEPDNPEIEELLGAIAEELDEQGEFDPTDIKDARERILSATVRRQGQPKFRKKLLKAYDGRCAITGCTVESVLEAAHIVPYQGEMTNHPSNGLLLRADVHTLFDFHLITINEDSLRLLVSSKLNGTNYEKYRDKKVRIPKETSREALKQHRIESGLG